MLTTWTKWPRTYAALVATYFRSETFATPGEYPANGNYMLAGLGRFADVWNANHAHRNVPQTALDAAAAHEIYYLANRSRKFNRPAAGLSACLTNLALERPERILERANRSAPKPAAAAS